jgi:hypothetical protein
MREAQLGRLRQLEVGARALHSSAAPGHLRAPADRPRSTAGSERYLSAFQMSVVRFQSLLTFLPDHNIRPWKAVKRPLG